MNCKHKFKLEKKTDIEVLPKSRCELLKETLEKSKKEYNSLPNWTKNAFSTISIFNPEYPAK